jgi:hypothetical protein
MKDHQKKDEERMSMRRIEVARQRERQKRRIKALNVTASERIRKSQGRHHCNVHRRETTTRTGPVSRFPFILMSGPKTDDHRT